MPPKGTETDEGPASAQLSALSSVLSQACSHGYSCMRYGIECYFTCNCHLKHSSKKEASYSDGGPSPESKTEEQNEELSPTTSGPVPQEDAITDSLQSHTSPPLFRAPNIVIRAPKPADQTPTFAKESTSDQVISFLTQALFNVGEDEEPDRLLISFPTQTQFEAIRNDKTERRHVERHAAIHYKDIAGGRLCSQNSYVRAKWRRVTIELAHMFVKVDIMFFLYHRVSDKYLDREVIPRDIPKTSRTYDFILDKLHGHIEFIEKRQVRAIMHTLEDKPGANSLIKNWGGMTAEERGNTLETYWDEQPKELALFTNLIIAEIIDIDGIYGNEYGAALRTFCKGKYLVSASYFVEAYLRDPNEYPGSLYRKIPSLPEMEPFKKGVGKMRDVPVRQWVRDVMLDGFVGGGKVFFFTEFDKAKRDVDTRLIKKGYLVAAKKCAQCLDAPPPDHEFRDCGGCKAVKYCSLYCQQLDWMDHKPKCKKVAMEAIEEEEEPESEDEYKPKE